MSADRDWVYARRFRIRRMIEQGNPDLADVLPEIGDLLDGDGEQRRGLRVWNAAEREALDEATAAATPFDLTRETP